MPLQDSSHDEGGAAEHAADGEGHDALYVSQVGEVVGNHPHVQAVGCAGVDSHRHVQLSTGGPYLVALRVVHPATGHGETGYTHDANCVVYRGPDTEHSGKEICFGSNETALSIADVSDKEAPSALAVSSYPNVAYAHQGWLDEAHEYLYMNDELDEAFGTVSGTRTVVWDVRDLDDPIPVKDFIGTTEATDHNLYVVGNLMYQSNYLAGLRVISIAARENPVEVAFFDIEPVDENHAGLNDGSWSNYPFFASGVIGVTSMGGGVFFVRLSDGN